MVRPDGGRDGMAGHDARSIARGWDKVLRKIQERCKGTVHERALRRLHAGCGQPPAAPGSRVGSTCRARRSTRCACWSNDVPKAVGKDELHARLWPGTYVVDANLSVVVAEVRRVLGDDPQAPRFIRTVHRIGYAFCADVSQVRESRTREPRAWLVWNDRVDRPRTGRERDRTRSGVPSLAGRERRVAPSCQRPSRRMNGRRRGSGKQERDVRRWRAHRRPTGAR